jgi:uncharacterized membrane protein YdjX (TVP38/TMEM64 family)
MINTLQGPGVNAQRRELHFVRKPSTSSLVKLGLLLALIAGAISFRFGTDTGREITFQSIRDYIRTFPPLLVPLLYIAIYVVGTVLFFPGLALSIAGAVLFDLFEATLYTWIGATLGATLAFLLARLLGRDFFAQILAGRLQTLDERLSRHGFFNLLILRLVPLIPFNAINFGAGLTSIRLRDYVLATAIGILPGTFIYQYFFSRVGEANPFDPQLLAALGLLLLFTLAGKWLSVKLRAKPPASPPAP